MNCRHCKTELTHTFLDLGFAPPSNAYLNKSDLQRPETYLPLKVMVCSNCFLVQTLDYASSSEFFNSEYAYLSSATTSWLQHAKDFTYQIKDELSLSNNSKVIEIASNDGYLLQNFVEIGIPCIGIEPTESTAKYAREKNIPVISEFFTEKLADSLISNNEFADLVIGNNVYAHVPDINDFTKSLKKILKNDGVITLEFPHLLELIKHMQFDTIYHEHFSYLSLLTVDRIFKSNGLKIYKVKKLTTHGGSIRIYACHIDAEIEIDKSVFDIIKEEKEYKLNSIDGYNGFQEKVIKIKNDLLSFLINQKNNNKIVVAYGAAAKGNTFLNFAGIKNDLINAVYDIAESKQNKFMPGSHIPIYAPIFLKEANPDFVLILPWNIADEVISQTKKYFEPKTKFIKSIPELFIYE